MEDVFRFRKFRVYQDARFFRKEIKLLVKKSFPKEERFGLTSQIFRALDSVLLNIAEGSQKYTDLDFSRFLNMALASVNEVVACFDCAFDYGYINSEEHFSSCEKASCIHKQLKTFISKLYKDT
ncbi:MAG: four helix bundle protein [Patescibacteria group bacterium]|nr:four helix bundle protein [Patescibacteria group bacterium]MBU2509660.1 four helix bundle protein [Patescibacteria group bacterium]